MNASYTLPTRRILIAAVAVLTMALSACSALSAKPMIWFCALDPRPGYGGCPDYMDIYQPDAPWVNAASHVDIYKIYPQWISKASDADLKTQFADLKRRHIGLALEFGVLTGKPGRGQGVEGQGGEWLLRMAQRIRDNGGELKYVAFDEPTFYGTIYNGKNAFDLTIDDMVQNAAANINEMWTVFPDVQVGDIEPLVNGGPEGMTRDQIIGRYAQGIEGFQKALGKPLAFFHCDLDWNDPDYTGYLTAVRKWSKRTTFRSA